MNRLRQGVTLDQEFRIFRPRPAPVTSADCCACSRTLRLLQCERSSTVKLAMALNNSQKDAGEAALRSSVLRVLKWEVDYTDPGASRSAACLQNKLICPLTSGRRKWAVESGRMSRFRPYFRVKTSNVWAICSANGPCPRRRSGEEARYSFPPEAWRISDSIFFARSGCTDRCNQSRNNS